ncbi:type 4b pilus protein PilO2 [Candidatus Williamhamiltonella defendens]|uniref:type 4b pilus protein PilO2 n=2 Tax=Candidatus Williamhamiltonella defendens TaxID=138072 RepID=UPI000D602BD8|nr:type 4b pilus protein PilO2 [Candidatus Hamiltonella defensa]AWK17494.1 pilus assembly protein PilO [Candidatus Hamiltonella defensa]
MSHEKKPIHIVTYNKKSFVVGLEWRAIKGGLHFMREVKEIGKRENLEVVAIRQNESIQAGFAPKFSIPLKGKYSLAVSLVSLIPGKWLAVIPVESMEDNFIVIASTGGLVMPWTDKIVPAEALEQEVVDITARLSQGEGEVKVFGDKRFLWVTDERDWSDVLAVKNLKKEFKLKPLTWGLTQKEKIGWASFFIFILSVLYFLNEYWDHQEHLARLMAIEKQKLADDINQAARYQASLLSLKPPWVDKPSVHNFIRSCSQKIQDIPLSLGGWIPAQITCFHDKAELLFARLEGSAVGALDFKWSVEKRYSVTPRFNGKQTGAAVFFLPIHAIPEGDDPLLPLSHQRDKLMTLLQRHNLRFTLTEVPAAEKKTDEQGIDFPLPNWREMHFSYESAMAPRMIFKESALPGMRIKKIVLLINQDNADIQYQVQGVMYGKP